jgi:hypothetical protein
MADSKIVVFIGADFLQAWKVPEELTHPHLPDEALNLVVPVPPPDITDIEVPLEGSRCLYVSAWYSGKDLFFDHLAGDDDLRRTVFPIHPEIPDHWKGQSIADIPWNFQQRLKSIQFTKFEDYKLCEDKVISLCANDKDIRAFVMPQPTPVIIHPPPPSEPCDILMTSHSDSPFRLHPEYIPPRCSFDPISGRMCSTRPGKDVIVYDFLRQPCYHLWNLK